MGKREMGKELVRLSSLFAFSPFRLFPRSVLYPTYLMPPCSSLKSL